MVNLETQNNKRRSSFSGALPVDESQDQVPNQLKRQPLGTMREAEPINFYPSPKNEEKRSSSKPPKAFQNPFDAATSPSPPRPVHDILALLSDFDLDRAVQERHFDPTCLPVKDLYCILKEESNSRVTLDEVKTLVKHVRDKSGVVA